MVVGGQSHLWLSESTQALKSVPTTTVIGLQHSKFPSCQLTIIIICLLFLNYNLPCHVGPNRSSIFALILRLLLKWLVSH